MKQTSPHEQRTYRFGLTADEWIAVAGAGEDSEVGPCCANLSELREHLNALVTLQGDTDGFTVGLIGNGVARAYAWCADDHDLTPDQFPLLHRVLAGLRDEHDVDAYKMAEAYRHDKPDSDTRHREWPSVNRVGEHAAALHAALHSFTKAQP